MKTPLLLVPLFLTAAAALLGCDGGDDGSLKPAVAFAGKPDPRFAGTWKTTNTNSTYQLKEDGTYVLDAKISTPGGNIDSRSEGSWAVNNDRMLFKDQSENVTPYSFKLEGNTLTLTLTGSMKNETVLKRQ